MALALQKETGSYGPKQQAYAVYIFRFMTNPQVRWAEKYTVSEWRV